MKNILTAALGIALAVAGTTATASQRDSIKAQAMFTGQYTPISEIVRLGTHNSYNSSAHQNGYPRYIDPQQTNTITEQLNMGARFIELDIHWKMNMENYKYDYLLCHGGFCSGSDRYLTEGLSDVNGWLASNPGEVVILYVEDHSGGASPKLYDRFVTAGIANKIYPSGGCKNIPGDLTHADVLGAGKQVILWKDGRDGSPACYEGADSRFSNLSHTGLGGLTRVWEDATIIGALFDNAGDGRIDATDVANYAASGINIINLDDMSSSDGRNEKILWSWNNGEPNNVNNEDCAIQVGDTGRWYDGDCSAAAKHACQNIVTGEWALGAQASSWVGGAASCAALGTNFRFAAPVNPATNTALKTVANGENVWIAMNDRGVEGDWTAPSFEYRHLQDGRSNHCMIIEGGAIAGNPLKSGNCSEQFNNDKWLHEQSSGLLRSQEGNLCASTDGNNAVADKLKARPCNASDTNQQFELVGTTLRPVNNPSVSVYTFSPELGAEIGLWGNSTESHQQWKFGGKGVGSGNAVSVPTELLQYTIASGAHRVWADSGSGADHDGSIWRLNALEGFHSLGDMPIRGYTFASAIEKVLVKGGQSSIAAPTGYVWVWNDSGSGADADINIWRPIAPVGFVCLGDIITQNHGGAPSTDAMRCVHENYVEQSPNVNWKWNDSGSGSDHDVTWWDGHNADGSTLNIGSLRAFRSYATPSAATFNLITRSKSQRVLADGSIPPAESWSQLPSTLRQVEVGQDGTLIGTASNDSIWQWNGATWNQISGGLRHISVGSANHIWGVNAQGMIYRYNGNNSWTQISGALTNVSVGSDGTVWGVNVHGSIYRYNGNNSWTQIPGGLRQVSVANANNVIGINTNNTLFSYHGSGWTIVGEGVKQASIDADGTIWIVKTDNSVYTTSDLGATWVSVTTSFVNISTGSATQVVGVAPDGTIWKRDF